MHPRAYTEHQAPNEPGDCYDKQSPTADKPAPPSTCAKFTTPQTCPTDRCEWGQEAGEPQGECWELEATTTANAAGAQQGKSKITTNNNRRLEAETPMGFVKLASGEVAGPMATVIMHALHGCEWAPGYDWIVMTDAWINSVSSEPAANEVRVLG